MARLLAKQRLCQGARTHPFVDPRLPPRHTTDPSLPRQILLHLVGNAIKLTEQDGVRLRGLSEDRGPQGPGLYFEVIDPDIGIAEDRRAELFEEFSQLDRSHTAGPGLAWPSAAPWLASWWANWVAIAAPASAAASG